HASHRYGLIAPTMCRRARLFKRPAPSRPAKAMWRLENRRPERHDRAAGEMAEWLKEHAWKACLRETVTWVRIPLPPPALARTHSLAVDGWNWLRCIGAV